MHSLHRGFLVGSTTQNPRIPKAGLCSISIGLKVSGLRFRVPGSLGFRVSGSGLRV